MVSWILLFSPFWELVGREASSMYICCSMWPGMQPHLQQDWLVGVESQTVQALVPFWWACGADVKPPSIQACFSMWPGMQPPSQLSARVAGGNGEHIELVWQPLVSLLGACAAGARSRSMHTCPNTLPCSPADAAEIQSLRQALAKAQQVAAQAEEDLRQAHEDRTIADMERAALADELEAAAGQLQAAQAARAQLEARLAQVGRHQHQPGTVRQGGHLLN